MEQQDLRVLSIRNYSSLLYSMLYSIQYIQLFLCILICQILIFLKKNPNWFSFVSVRKLVRNDNQFFQRSIILTVLMCLGGWCSAADVVRAKAKRKKFTKWGLRPSPLVYMLSYLADLKTCLADSRAIGYPPHIRYFFTQLYFIKSKCPTATLRPTWWWNINSINGELKYLSFIFLWLLLMGGPISLAKRSKVAHVVNAFVNAAPASQFHTAQHLMQTLAPQLSNTSPFFLCQRHF